MGNPIEPGQNPRGSVVWVTVCGLVGAAMGGPAAVLCVGWLHSLYVEVWDPPGKHGYQIPQAGLETALFYTGIVFMIGAALGAFVALKLAARMTVWGWGLVGAFIGGCGALFLARSLLRLYVWKPPIRLFEPERAFLYYGIGLMCGAALGALVAMELARRRKQRSAALPPPASGWQDADRTTRRSNGG